MVIVDKLSSVIINKDQDPSEIGRWTFSNFSEKIIEEPR